MKSNKLFLAAAAATALLAPCALSSCSGSADDASKVRTLADYKNPSAADSLIYYFGQLRAVDYWQIAYSDTTRRSRESRDQYLRGVKAGLDAIHDNDAYNEGVLVGLQLAMNMKEFEEEFSGVKFNRSVLINAIEDGLINDSIVDAGEANRNFRDVLEQLSAQKEVNDRKAGAEALEKEAKAQNWQKVSETLYAGKREGGNGQKYQPGQTVDAGFVISTLSGQTVDSNNRNNITIGKNYPGPITDALLTMSPGETATFYTYAMAIFGRYYERMNVKPTEILVVKLTSGAALPPAQADSIPR